MLPRPIWWRPPSGGEGGGVSYFANKTALITGGASGIGRSLARALLARGASVRIADIVDPTTAAGELGCEGVVVDVTDREAVARCVEEFAAKYGRLDFLFNNAGVVVFGEARWMSYEDWARVLDVNVRGVVNGIFSAYRLMIQQGEGHIVNTASVAGLAPTPGAAPYSASKHAVVGLTLALRAEAAAHGVRVSAICPGFVRTGMVDGGKHVGPLDRRRVLEAIEQRFGWMEPDDLAAVALAGVERNRALIVAPRSARLIVGILRHFPALGERFALQLARRLREFAA